MGVASETTSSKRTSIVRKIVFVDSWPFDEMALWPALTLFAIAFLRTCLCAQFLPLARCNAVCATHPEEKEAGSLFQPPRFCTLVCARLLPSARCNTVCAAHPRVKEK